MSTPGVVFKLEFVYDWHIGENDFIDYMDNPEKFNPQLHNEDEYKDMLDYMRNDEKSDGAFDSTKDILSYDELNDCRRTEAVSKDNGNPKYLGVLSFDNEFLKEHGIINSLGTLNVILLKHVARAGMAELVHTSDKLRADNVSWVGAIHTNTDNVHVHFQIWEQERTRDKENDLIEIKAINSLKSKVVNKIVGDYRTVEITRMAREVLLPKFQQSISVNTALLQLAKAIPDEAQYNRPKMRKYQKDINSCVDIIVNSNPELKKNFDEYTTMLDKQSMFLKDAYGDGRRHLYENYKKNKMNDWYVRAGNSLLSYIKEFKLKELVEETPPPFDYEASLEGVDVEAFFEPIQDVLSEEKISSGFSDEEFISFSEGEQNSEKNLKGYELYAEAKNLLDKNSECYDPKQGIALMMKSAEENNQWAQYVLGKVYFQGEYVEQDFSKAVKYFQAAAKPRAIPGTDELGKGNQWAQYYLGRIYMTDKEHRNLNLSLHYLKQSAAQGNQSAERAINKIYLQQKSVRKVSPAYKLHKQQLSSACGNALKKLYKEYDNHVKSLQHEFEIDELQKEQDRIQTIRSIEFDLSL